MQSSRQYDELIELKTELGTVVEALDILHDFIDSVFGAKFNSFCGSLYQSQGVKGNGNVGNPREALRDLRWKHCRNRNGSSSSRGDLIRRSSSSSSSTSQVFTHSSSGRGANEECQGLQHKQGERATPPTPTPSFGVVDRPEMIEVNVKLEAEVEGEEEDEVPDFLRDVDVDPFYVMGDQGEGERSSYGSTYNYEGDSEVKYVPPYQASPPETATSNPARPIPVNECPLPSSRPGRSILPPGLIPIVSSDPLHENPLPYIIPNSNIEEIQSSSSGSGSDLDWQPSPSSKKTKSEAKKNRKKLKKSSSSRRDSIDSTTRQFIGLVENFTAPKPPSSTKFSPQKKSSGGSVGGGGGELSEEGPFKCSMCPASYKQEDSLRSHQKYKHNPSRVQCTCHLCGKSMVDKYRLQRHLRLHTGEKPFECQFCGQSFYRKDYHTKHLQRKHGFGLSGSSPATPSPQSMKPRNQRKSAPPTPSSTVGIDPDPLRTDGIGRASCTSSESPNTPPVSIPPDDQSTFMNYFNAAPPTSNSTGSLSSSLITMTSLTFDDLISADL